MFCSHCGKQVEEGTAFCSNCGHPVTGSLPVASNNTQPVQTNQPKKKINATIPIILGIAVVFIVALVIILVKLTKKDEIVVPENTVKEEIFNAGPYAGANMHVGDTVVFGSYEQDNDKSNGTEPIEWIVLDEKGGRYLLLSKYVLDGQKWDDSMSDNTIAANATGMDDHGVITWEKCSVRRWLNGSFYNEAFSDEDKNHIAQVTNTNPSLDEIDGMEYGGQLNVWKSGADTQDTVFLLSLEEYIRYFHPTKIGYGPYTNDILNEYTAPGAMASPTKYVQKNELTVCSSTFDYSTWNGNKVQSPEAEESYNQIEDIYKDNGYLAAWFLRTPGGSYTPGSTANDTVLMVWPNYISLRNYGKSSLIGIRPAVWVSF